MEKRGVLLSTLWIAAVFNFLYNDVFAVHFLPVFRKEYYAAFLSGYTDSVKLTEQFVFAFAIIMETTIAMIVLSRIAGYRLNRTLNIVIPTLHALIVGSTLRSASATPFYLFFAFVEMSLMVAIVVIAVKWRRDAKS